MSRKKKYREPNTAAIVGAALVTALLTAPLTALALYLTRPAPPPACRCEPCCPAPVVRPPAHVMTIWNGTHRTDVTFAD